MAEETMVDTGTVEETPQMSEQQQVEAEAKADTERLPLRNLKRISPEVPISITKPLYDEPSRLPIIPLYEESKSNLTQADILQVSSYVSKSRDVST